MAHKHSVYDSDTHLRINPTTRTLAIEGFTKNTIVQHDHNSERFTFELPRFIEGHDMLVCNSVQVHYLNVDAKTQETSNGVFVVTDLQESPEDENIAIFSWLISSNATKYVGSLNFCIRFACISEENTVDYAWNTAVNTTMRVTDGINNAEIIIQEYADVLEQWRADISSNIYDFLPEALQFGSEISTGGDTLKFDGNAEGKELVGEMFVHVSDATPTLTSGTIEVVGNGQTNTEKFTQNEVVEKVKGFSFVALFGVPMAMVVTSEVLGIDLDGITFEKEGTYLLCTEEDGMPMYVKSLKIDGCTDFPSIKKLDTKYLPSHLQFGEEINEILPPTELFYEDDFFGVMALIEGVEIGETYTVNYNGVDYESTAQLFEGDGNTVTVLGNMGAVVGSGDNGQPFVLMILPPEAFAEAGVGGLFMPLDGATSVTLSISCEKIKKLDTKYIDAEWMATSSINEEVLCDETLDFSNTNSRALSTKFDISKYNELDVICEGVKYTCDVKKKSSDGFDIHYVGNLSKMGGDLEEDTGEPFLIMSYTMNGELATGVYHSMYSPDVSIKVIAIIGEINKLPYKFNTEPIIFTTTDMRSATCNKTYQECVEALNNYCFNGYLIMGTVDDGQIMPFNVIIKSKEVVNDVVTREFIRFAITLGNDVILIEYDNNNEITISMEAN